MKYNVKAYQVINGRFLFIGQFGEVEDLEALRKELGNNEKKIIFTYEDSSKF